MSIGPFITFVAVCIVCMGCGEKGSGKIPAKPVERSARQDEGNPGVAVNQSVVTSVQPVRNTATTGMASVAKDALAAARATAKGVLVTELATYAERNYSPAKWRTLTGFKAAGDAAIDAALNLTGVTTAQTAATTGMAGVEKNALAVAKIAAKSVVAMALATYPESNYSSVNWALLSGFKIAGDTAIDAATDLAGVTSAQNTAITGMPGVERDALALAKVTAKGALATALATYPETNTSPANWKILTGFKSAGDTAIDAATDMSRVTLAQNSATIGMAGVEKDALAAAKKAAKDVLTAALATYTGSNYSLGNWRTLIAFKATGDAAIDAATDVTNLTFVRNTATLGMEGVDKDALVAVRTAALAAIAAALTTYTETNYSPATWKTLTGLKSAGDAAIVAAINLAGVASAQNTASTGMAEVEKDALIAARIAAKGVLDTALATYLDSNYSPGNWVILTGYKFAGDTAISAATDLVGVTTPRNTATNSMAGVAMDALTAAKATAKGVLVATLATYTESNYSPANWAALTGFKTAADTAIDAASDQAGVTSALNAGLGYKK
ncbi:MAG: hypothetical protein WCN95_10590 [bacterium]